MKSIKQFVLEQEVEAITQQLNTLHNEIDSLEEKASKLSNIILSKMRQLTLIKETENGTKRI